jgi:hypothetical protein
MTHAIERARSGRRAAQVARSQLALKLAIALYALVMAISLLRIVVLILGFAPTVWSVHLIVAVSRPLALPLSVVPGANRVVLGAATLADLTTTIAVMAAPLLLMSRRTE